MNVVIVTGASGGIGKDLANQFADKGYIVIAVDIIEHDFAHKNIYFKKADLSSESDIQEVFKFAKTKFNAVHILINNGAISNFSKPILEIETCEFDEVININLRASFICCKEFVKANAGEDFGRIINISSTRNHQNEADWEAYGASKGGIISLTNSLCVSLSNTKITVNAISPGWIQTKDYENLSISDHAQHPSGRVGKPSDITRACLFLADELNDFINGANLIIDGGMTKKMIYD